ncbi:MAG: hypothetical protein AABW79_00830 [Nanoarchaeota archaeon]
MTDIFEQTVLCKDCHKKMEQTIVQKNGFELRALVCPQCSQKIIHPADVNNFEHYNNLKGKTYNVKLRVIGNGHAISIPKEIVDFIQQQEKMMNDMVKLCFEDMHRLRLDFGGEDDDN